MLKKIYSVFPAFLLAVFLFISVPAQSPEAAANLDRTSRTLPVYSISGQIRSGGAELSGVQVTLSGDSMATSTTDGSGIYRFLNINEGDTVTITPTLANYIFSPPSRTFTSLGGDQTNVNFTATEICPAQNCYTNGRIAFVRNDEIYTSNHAGADLINLTNNPADDFQPMYSPDGNKIVFISRRDGNNEIYLMDASDGGNPTRLTTNPASELHPSFSPDGTKIIFASERDGNFEIYTMNADGTNQLRLTNNSVNDTAPSFSADGSKIVFARVVPPAQRAAIFSMNADSSNQTQLTTPSNANGVDIDGSPSFSPDGSRIIFTRLNSATFRSPLFMINADGTNLTRLTAANSVIRNPSFAPNGLRIIYTASVVVQQQVRDDIYTRSLVNGEEKLLVPNGMNADWQPVYLANVRTPFDFDGDRKADISVFRPSNAIWYISNSSDNFLVKQQLGSTGVLITPADFDGDGKTDISVFRPAGGVWSRLNSSNNTVTSTQFGMNGDLPVPGDFDGDGKADTAVYRPSAGSWFRINSSNNLFVAAQFGIAEDKPVVGDFDGDGKSDLTVFRPSAGAWYRINSATDTFYSAQFGIAEDMPVAADYDGDGKTDLAVYRPSAGDWYIANSGNNSFSSIHFGVAEDKPAPADYDGDGKADLAVFRPSAGNWYLLRTTAGFTGFQFGVSGDIPAANAFVR